MSCCGEKRSKIYHDPWSHSRMEEGPNTGQTFKMPESVNFLYEGKTSLTATGVITGKVYRFGKTGDIVEVDRRDVPFMTGIPNLSRSLTEKQG